MDRAANACLQCSGRAFLSFAVAVVMVVSVVLVVVVVSVVLVAQQHMVVPHGLFCALVFLEGSGGR